MAAKSPAAWRAAERRNQRDAKANPSHPVHRNTAARRKSLMARKLKALQGGGAASASKPAKGARAKKA